MAGSDARFAVNLRPDTASADFRAKLRPWGYLAPPAALTAATRAAARTFRAEGLGLVVDNGRFDDIGRIAAHLASDSGAVTQQLTALARKLRRSPLRADLPPPLRDRIDHLEQAVERAASTTVGMPLAEQVALGPTAVIGVEDIVPAAWLRVGLDAALVDDVRRKLRQRNEAVAAAAAKIRTPRSLRHLPVASALDYDSAFDAGRAFARAGLKAAAMGFGAYMADDGYSDVVTVGGRVQRLPQRLPLRYLRCALVARGFWDGWRAAGRGHPAAFHFLGLGAPIMVGVVAVAAAATPSLTFDALSPIKDAVEGTLYSAQPTYLKVRTRRAAAKLATGTWTTWWCRCPFCRAFVAAHPFDYERGRRWAARRRGPEEVGAKDLGPGGALFGAYPLLAEPASGRLRAEVNVARSGHNHWVLEQIMADVRTHGRSLRALTSHIGGIVEAYGQATRADVYAVAVRTAFDIVRGLRFVPR